MKKQLAAIACITLLFNITTASTASASMMGGNCKFYPSCKSSEKLICPTGWTRSQNRGWSKTCYKNTVVGGPFESAVHPRTCRKKTWQTKQADRFSKGCKRSKRRRRYVGTGPFGKKKYVTEYSYIKYERPRGKTKVIKCNIKYVKVKGCTPNILMNELLPAIIDIEHNTELRPSIISSDEAITHNDFLPQLDMNLNY